jgi:TolB-like protein/DNA-binding winged helix-turn-helix (wHTH) protein
LLSARTNLYRFGEFTLDPASGELRRNGNTVRLQPQPLQVLLALLGHPGQVVTREEFRSSLWTEDTNVEFDDGLNHAIRRLRDALSDTAQVPRYIETIPRRGYRLIPTVDVESPPPPAIPPGATSAGLWRRYRWFAVAAACIAIAALTTFGIMHRRSAAHINSLAVLPLANFSGDSDQEYFADGITEELTTELARIGTLRVISRTSAMRLKGTKLSLQQIGRELGVDAVVEGSVQRSGSRVRISAQLVQVATERHLWAETYERELQDVLHVRSDVARDIAARVRREVAPNEGARLAQNSVPAQAYDAFLIGTRLASRGDSQGFEESLRYFEEAIRLDPSFALAYAELSESHGMLAFMSGDRGDHFLKAKDAANKAFELDSSLPEARIGSADMLFYYEWDWTQCEGPFRQTAEKYPNSVEVQYHYGLCLFVLGRYDDALQYLERARRVDPLSPLINRVIGWLLGRMDRSQEAINQLLRARDLEPSNPVTYSLLSWAYERVGMEPESVTAYITSRKLAGDPEADIERLTHAYGNGGKRAFDVERRAILKLKLDSLLQKEKRESVKPLTIASLCASIGNADLAFHYLDRTYAERDPRLTWIKSGIQWEPLRADPRFHELVRRMGLPE